MKIKDAVFAKALKEIRESKMLSQVKLAEMSGVPVASICKFEAGDREPSLTSFRKLVFALDVTADALLTGDKTVYTMATKAWRFDRLKELFEENEKRFEA